MVAVEIQSVDKLISRQHHVMKQGAGAGGGGGGGDGFGCMPFPASGQHSTAQFIFFL